MMSTRQTKNCLLFIFVLPMFYVLTLVLPTIASDALDVCKSGCTYSTIQSAINAAVSGDTIRVVQGSYTENLSISSKSNISLQGGYEDSTFAVRDTSTYATIIDAQGTANTIKILNSEGIAIDGFNIKNGQASSGEDGGGVHVESDGSKTNVTLSNNSISGNYADWGGGVSAIALNSGSTILNLNNNDISMNRAYQSGGGLAVNTEISSSIEINLSGNTILYNQADSYGGGLYINPFGSITFVSNNDVIQKNKASGGGGGLAAYGDTGNLSITISNNNIDDNSGAHGGGIYIQPYDKLSLSASIKNSSITGNSGTSAGGGIYIYANQSNNSTFEFLENTIANNSTNDNYGGGIMVFAEESSYTLNLDKNIIEGNEGRGIYIYNGYSFFGTGFSTLSGKFENNFITDNRCSGTGNYGGGILIDNSGTANINFVNNTISGNYADGGGGGVSVSSSSGTPRLSFLNDIIYGNVGSVGSDIYNNENSSSIGISYSDIGTTFGSYKNGTGNLNVDPLFFNSLIGDYHLSSNSPVIDKGTSSVAIDGDARPMGAGIDIGADEYNPNAFSLTVSKSGTGSGIVTSADGGINCGSDCSNHYNSGTSVTLTATSETFSGWSGDYTSTSGNTCTVIMDSDKTVTATFSGHILSVNKTGSGDITSSPSGINCGSDCSEVYANNTEVTLAISTDSGWEITGLEFYPLDEAAVMYSQLFELDRLRAEAQFPNALFENYLCSITMDKARTVIVTFKQNTNARILTVSKSGSGSGTVTGGAIDCGSDCSQGYIYGTSVTLTATADSGSTFDGWSGSTSTSGNSCTVIMKSDTTVTATFTTLPCNAASLDAEPEPLKLKKEEGADETVTVTCEDGAPVAGITVTATVTKGKKRVSVSPASAVTDASGQATFTITATKKTGNAKVRFEADGLRDNVSVKVE